MDPASILVVLLAAWAIAQRTPGIIGQAAEEWRAGLGGTTTGTAEDLRGRLADAGVEPSTDKGPLGNFLSNLWRDYWHNKDRDRRRNEAGRRAGEEQGWWRKQLTAAEDAQTAKYRGNTENGSGKDGQQPPTGSGPDKTGGGPDGPAAPRGPGGQGPDPVPGSSKPGSPPQSDPPPGDPPESRPPIHVPSSVGPEMPRPQTGGTATPELVSPRAENEADGTWQEPAPPIRVPLSVGPSAAATAVAVLDPPIAQPDIEGTKPMGTAVATNGVAITSMTTGAYEMSSVDARLQGAIAQFVAELTQLQNRLMRAGESTLGTVQLSGHSTVMKSMGQAVEAISALKAAARSCTSEVSPLVMATKREFEKRI